MIEKLKTALWFLARPSHWAQARELGMRKLRPDRDGSEFARAAHDWATARAVPVAEALAAIGMTPASGKDTPRLPERLLAEARARAKQSKVMMGGPGDIDLLYAATRLSGAARVVETGVAYGWSSLAILAALKDREGAKLVSVDMPYPKMNN